MQATATCIRSFFMTPISRTNWNGWRISAPTILKLCVAVGGVLTGEHGVGVEKRDLMGEMFKEDDLAQQQRVKCVFDDKHLLNPGKVFPVLHRCAELDRMHVHQGQLPFPDIPRF
ncbi:FAD-linked oxidase C-terminal domain-containing protein [Breoghania sp.]|uniref:FAD-linked oxidase C-terminal domain-containing protein n=1 Tax=Breoghania sp. TaxID=2065378 RepID=UPI0026216648|nr:FAD-linked oxidase C-terminal domain-containing protein [Breoghania sp.]MDJ0930157.1 FAD-linked oxidase C-terminal domain-containing protein [Breoghania sp.]